MFERISYELLGLREALTIEQQLTFLSFIKRDKVYFKYYEITKAIFGTAIFGTTMRSGEITGLIWDDIYLKNRIIRVDHQLCYHSVNGKYTLQICKQKFESGIREISMIDEIYLLFVRMRADSYFSSIHSGIEVDGYRNFVFLNARKNNVIIPRQLSDSLSLACEKYNRMERRLAENEDREENLLPKITSHVLRHTACTLMAEAGVDIKVLQLIMGHKNPLTTMDIYNHVDLHRMTREMKKIKPLESRLQA